MKTFSELIDNNLYTFPEYVDEATRELLIKRFAIRKCPKNFDRLFTFDLDIYYPQYVKLLRVDPKTTEIDWFVQNYMERQTYSNKVETADGVENSNEANNRALNVITYGQTIKSGSDTGTVTNTVYNTTTKDFKEDGNGTNHSGNVTDGASDDNSRNMSFARTNPMSASYNKDDMSQMFNSNAQTLKAGNKGNLTNGGKTYGIPYPKIKNPSSSADSIVMNAGVTYSESTTDGNDTYHKDGNGTDILDGSNTEKRNLKNSETDINNGSNNTTDNSTSQAVKQNVENNQGEYLTQELYTGRNALPAEVLRGAVSFISRTNAFKWLYRTLDNNFMQTYEREDYYEFD